MYKSILIPTDGSEFAAKGVEAGLALAKSLGAKVTFLTVSEPLPTYVGLEPTAMSAVFTDYDQVQATAAAAVLAAAKQKAESQGISAETHYVARSGAADAILATAQSKGHDLIVMASHGRRGVRRLILGSQTAEVLAHSTIPVLVVR
jgi:nucleotide-binding universal stress UspA family protein